MASKDLATKDKAELATYGDMPDYTVTEQFAPFLNANGQIGKWVASDDGSERDQVEIVLLAEKRGRVYFSQPYKKGEEQAPDCRSFDGVHGEGDPHNNEVKTDTEGAYICESCPMSKWAESEPPPCSEMRILLALDKEFDSPAIIQFKRTALGSWRKFKTSLDKLRRAGKSDQRPSYAYTITCTWEAQENYYVPKFAVTSELDEEESATYAQLVSELYARFSGMQPEYEPGGPGDATNPNGNGKKASDDIPF